MNKIILGDCLEVMRGMADGCIDLTVTSPPYDDLRTYGGYSFEFEPIARELYRVTKDGGVVVWVVGDQTKNGSESGTSFKQALYFKECGFNLHDTMIYLKDQLAYPDTNRYYNAFEYMFVFSKGKPKTVNLIKDKKNKSFGRTVSGKGRQSDGTSKARTRANEPISEYGVRWNYWLIYNQTRGIETQHPAIFPLQLAKDHITTWSEPNDTVLDPFLGSGTTTLAAQQLDRNYIGIEVNSEYVKIAQDRLKQEVLL